MMEIRVLLKVMSVKLHGQAGVASTDTSCDSAVTGGLPQHLTSQHSPRDASPAG